MAEYSAQTPYQIDPALASRLARAKEDVWFRIGVMQSTMNDRERALDAFERVLAVNPANVRAMTQAGAVLAKKECYPQAVSYLQRAITADSDCGEAWAVLAHCYVMTDDLQKAYQAYQNALTNLPNPRDPNLWYGIGLLYDRYGSLENALEAFLLVLSIAPDFERADEVCFCIGIIYKEQQNFDEALKYFNKVVVAANPPPPLTRADGWYQIGHVSELKRDIPAALELYKQALTENPKHPKTLQNYGWLEHQHNNNSSDAIRLLKLSTDLDSTDGQTWYLLGRVYMALRQFRQAYDAYQQAVYRDGRNATFWCSIGVLYYQMNQYRDAMDAYSRAIRLNPYVSEVWYDLGTLYESCGQNDDAIDAYRRAAELAPDNTQITARLGVLESTMNPSAIQQQPKQEQQQPPHQSAPQPTHSGPQQVPQSQPQQMHPEMQHNNQPHLQLNPVGNRQFGQPLQQLAQPLHTRKSNLQQPSSEPQSHLQPPHQMGSQPISLPQPRHPNIPGGLGAASSSGAMDIGPISFRNRQQRALPDTHSMANNSSFPQDGRTSLPSAPLPSMPLPSPSNAPSMNHLNPMNSQPLPSQNPSSAVRDPINVMQQQRSGPLSTHMQNSSHQPMQQEGVLHSHVKDAQQRSHHQQGSVGQLPSPKQQQQQSLHSPQKAPMHNEQEDVHGPSQQQSAYDQNMNARSQAQQHQHPPQQAVTSPGQRSHHSHPSQPTSSLPQMHTLPLMHGLPQVQVQTTSDGPEKSDRHRGGLSGPGEDRDHTSAPLEPVNTGPQHNPVEPVRRNEYEGQEQHEEARIPKLTGPEGGANDGNGGGNQEVEPNNRVGFSGPHASHSMAPSRDRIPSMRESVGETGSSGPTPPRQMSIHEVAPSDSRDENRLHVTSRHEGLQREERDNNEQNVRDSQQVNGRTDGKSADRLPGMSSLPGPIEMNSNRNGREEGDQNGLPPVSAPSLALPSSGALPSMSVNDNGKPGNSPSHGGASPGGAGSGMGTAGASLPPLSGRNGSSLSRLNTEAKDMSSSGGLSSGLGLGTSSLTKFGSKAIGRAPTTPVSNAVMPSSLPSPLPSRKPTGSSGLGHSGRSPRLGKPSAGSSFKSMAVPVANSGYGQFESVPSPGSLPVLSALSSRGNYTEEDKSVQEKRGEQEGERESERRVESRSKFDDKAENGAGESGGRGRVSEDVLDNKPVFGVLRPEPSVAGDKEMERSDNDDKMKSPGNSSGRGGNGESVLSSKRENMSKDEMGRTPKRPRLLDVNDKEMGGSKGYGYEAMEDVEKGKESGQRKDDDMGKGSVSGGLNKVDTKGERRGGSTGGNGGGGLGGSGSQDDSSKKHHRRDSGGRNGESELGKVIDLPRLSNQPMPKLSAPPPLSGNTPLPSFRSERKNLTASRGSGGSAGVGKALNTDNSSRVSLTFALRSAPVSSIPSLKNIGGGSSGRGSGGDHEYENSPRMGETTSTKRVGDDKGDASMGRNGGRDRD